MTARAARVSRSKKHAALHAHTQKHTRRPQQRRRNDKNKKFLKKEDEELSFASFKVALLNKYWGAIMCAFPARDGSL